MPKHRWRNSVKSLFGNYVDPEKDEELRGSKEEIEGNVQMILKVLKEDSEGKEPLAHMIEDFHNQYQSLYARYDYLTDELRKKATGKRGTDSSSSSSSDSDDSPKKKDTKNGKFEKNVSIELEMALSEIDALKTKLEAIVDDKDKVQQECQRALYKTKESDDIIAELKDESSRHLSENTSLKLELENSVKLQAQLNQKLKEMTIEKENSIAERDAVVTKFVEEKENTEELRILNHHLHEERESIKLELDAVKEELSTLTEKLESAETEITKLNEMQNAAQQEIASLTSNISQLKGEISNAETKVQDFATESSQLKEKMAEKERELSSHLEIHEAHKQKLESAERELANVTEMHMASGEENISLSLKITQHQDEIKQGENKIQDLIAESSQLKEKLAEKERELSSHLEIHEANKKEATEKLKTAMEEISKLSQMQKAAKEENTSLALKISQLENKRRNTENRIQDLVAKLEEKEREFSAHMEIHEFHKEQASTRARDLELELDTLNSQRRDVEKQKSDEISALLQKLEDQEKDSLAQINYLKEQINRVQADAESLQVQKGDLEAQSRQKEMDASALVKYLTDEVHEKQLELESLLSQKRESEMHLEKRVKEISEFVFQIETLKEELASKNSELNRNSEEKETLWERVKDLELELNSISNQKLELEEQLKSKNQELSEFVVQTDSLKEVTEEQRKEREVLVLQVKNLNLELNTLSTQKDEIEEQLMRKSKELDELHKERGKLTEKTAEMEKVFTEKENEISTLKKKSEDGEREALSQITALTAEVSSLQEQLGSLSALKSEADIILDKRNGEISELWAQIEKLKEELSGKTADGEKLHEENESMEVQLKGFLLEVEILLQQKGEMEDQISSKLDEVNQLKEEKSSLESKISELENTLTERGDELIAVQRKMEDLQNEASTEIAALTKQIESLQQQLELLESQKSLLEVEIEKNKQESKESLVLAETNNAELVNKITEQEKMLKEQEDTIIKSCEEQNQLKVEFQNCEECLILSERKIKEVTQQFENEMGAKSREVNELEENQRLTSQKLHITEQLLRDKDESYLKKEEKLQEEQKLLEEKVATLSGIIDTYKEAQVKVVTEISDKVNGTLTSIDAFHVKFEEDYGHLQSRIYEIVNQLKETTACIKYSNVEKHQLRKEIASLAQQRSDEKDSVLQLKGRVIEMETTLQKYGDENKSLMTTVSTRETKMGELEKMVEERDEKMGELERKMKEKEVGFDSLIEEKREAIRQLCIWIEYHQSRYNELKDMISKTRGRRIAS